MKKSFQLKSFAVCFLFLAFFSSAQAVSVQEISTPTGFVNDFAAALTIEQKEALEQQVRQIESESTVEIGIALINSTDGRDIAEYAFDLANTWKIGKTGVFNGVLILVAVTDRQWFIATASGIEGTLPDTVVNRIGEESFPVAFRQGDYYGGLSAAVSAINGFVQNDESIVSRYTAVYEPPWWFTYFHLIFLGLLIVPSIFMHAAKALGQKPWLGLLLFDALAVAAIFSFTGEFNPIFWIFIGVFLSFFSLMALAQFYGRASGGLGGWHSGGGWRSSGGGGSFGGGGGFSGGGSGGRW